ncbi:chromosomal protein MC1 [archaeon]|nr:chromosomal protein MC1 [archaeon]
MAIRYFALRTNQSGDEGAYFTGRNPRQAALKAASRGRTDIFLRERGTKKLHHFRGSRSKVRAPPNKPTWMADMVWKPNVHKIGVVHLEKRSAKGRTARRAKVRRGRSSRRARRRR